MLAEIVAKLLQCAADFALIRTDMDRQFAVIQLYGDLKLAKRRWIETNGGDLLLFVELKVDLIILLAENGYPPVDRDEVYKEIFEQAENFKKYQGK